MNIAVACYNNRISTYLESSNELKIYNFDDENIQFNFEKSFDLTNFNIINLVETIRNNSIKIFVCGAIPNCLRENLMYFDITLYSWLTGDVETILEAIFHGNINEYLMPGCKKHECKQRRQHRFRRQFGRNLHYHF